MPHNTRPRHAIVLVCVCVHVCCLIGSGDRQVSSVARRIFLKRVCLENIKRLGT